MFIESHRFELLKVIQIESVRAISKEWNSLDGISVQEASQLYFERCGQDFEQITHILLGSSSHAYVLLEVHQQSFNEVGSDVELLVEIVDLLYSFLIDLT